MPTAPLAPLLFLALRVVTLAEAEKQAAANQPANLIADAQVELARAQQDGARAPLLPQVNANATVGVTTQNVATGVIAASGGWTTFHNGQLSLKQMIWDHSAIESWRAADKATEGARASADATRQQSLQNVRVAFFNARAARSLVDVGRDSVANYERHLKQIEGFVKVGNRPEIDVVQARADLSSARAQLIGAENDYATARAQLNQSMGVIADTDYDVSDDVLGAIDGEENAVDKLVEDATSHRPDVASLQRQIDAQELTIAAARGKFLPSFNVGAVGSVRANTLSETAANLQLSVGGTWDLYSGGATVAQVRQQRAQLAINNAQLTSLRLQLRLEVEQAQLAVRAALATLAAYRDAEKNARERLRLAEGRYANGVGNIIELGDAQTAVNAAAGQRIKAEYTVGVARAQLLRALGRS